MTSEPTNRPEGPPTDEIDFRAHVFACAAWWREIALLAVLAAAAGAGIEATLGPTWQATAAVAIVRTKTEATFDKQFSTHTEYKPKTVSVPQRQALQGLVARGNVAREVINALGDQLNEYERNPAQLIKQVSVRADRNTLRESDLILIVAETDAPDKAAAIANAWAEVYVRQVNRLYTKVPDETLAQMQKKVAEAQVAYDDAQRKVEEFAASSETPWIEQQILQQNLVLEAQAKTLSMYLNERRRLARLLADARSLRTHIEAADAASSPSNALALLLLKAEVFASSPPFAASSLPFSPSSSFSSPSLSPPFAFSPPKPEFSLDGVDVLDASTANQATDVDALIQTLQERIAQNERTIAQLLYGDAPAPVAEAGPLLRPPGASERALQWLAERKEALDAQQQQLLAERDRRWHALAALSEAQTGLELASNSVVPEVRLASLAVPPIEPTFHVSALPATGGALGLLAGLVLTLAANFLGLRPFLRKRP